MLQEHTHLHTTNTHHTTPHHTTQQTQYLLLQELPSSLSTLVELKALGVASNMLQGPLPEFLGSCTALRLLDISSNNITVCTSNCLGCLFLAVYGVYGVFFCCL
jgi:Leucine-rich repeat (LRR) protein